jgi:hypothetical protein
MANYNQHKVTKSSSRIRINEEKKKKSTLKEGHFITNLPDKNGIAIRD